MPILDQTALREITENDVRYRRAADRKFRTRRRRFDHFAGWCAFLAVAALVAVIMFFGA